MTKVSYKIFQGKKERWETDSLPLAKRITKKFPEWSYKTVLYENWIDKEQEKKLRRKRNYDIKKRNEFLKARQCFS